MYHAFYKPLEYTVPERSADQCYIKIISQKPSDGDLVLGIHFLGPNAGEIMQGFGAAIR